MGERRHSVSNFEISKLLGSIDRIVYGEQHSAEGTVRLQTEIVVAIGATHDDAIKGSVYD
jgi:hypothetical protein